VHLPLADNGFVGSKNKFDWVFDGNDVREGKITVGTAQSYSLRPEELNRMIRK